MKLDRNKLELDDMKWGINSQFFSYDDKTTQGDNLVYTYSTKKTITVAGLLFRCNETAYVSMYISIKNYQL